MLVIAGEYFFLFCESKKFVWNYMEIGQQFGKIPQGSIMRVFLKINNN
jgi:hypothetical protein